jgi:HSP20 family protein
MFALMPWRKEEKRGGLIPRMERPFRLLEEEFETLFNRFFGRLPMPVVEEEWPLGWGLVTEETEKEFLYRFELPGFEVPEIEVSVVGEMLTIEAEHKEPELKEGEVRERRYARIKRAVSLPAGVAGEKVEATYRNGILEVHLSKTPEAKGRKIEVKT